MRKRLSYSIVIAAWIAGVVVAASLIFVLGPQLQCAADPACASAGERWWHVPLLIVVAVGPGVLATIAHWRSRRGAA